MRVLQFCGFYPPSIGGIETYVQSLSEHLILQGHSVTVMSRYLIGEKPPSRVEMRRGVKIIWFTSHRNTPISTITTWIRILMSATREEFDVIHAHTVLPITTMGLILKRLTGKPLVSVIHESQFLFGMKKRWYRWLARKSLSGADFVHANSIELKSVAETLNLPKPVHLIGNAVDTQQFRPVRKNIIRKEISAEEKVQIVITTRRFVPKNGVIYLIKAIPLVLAQAKNVHFYVIGDGPERNNVEQEIRQLGITAQVTLKGAIRNEELPMYLNSADLYVLPSLKEGTSIAGLEAMACGLAMVGTNVGGIPEIITEDVNGYLCMPENPTDLANAIVHALKNKKRLGAESSRMVKKYFSWDKRSKEITTIYDTVITAQQSNNEKSVTKAL